MNRLLHPLGFSVAAILALVALPASARAQIVLQPAPCPTPVVAYYAPPPVAYYAPQPVVGFYSPAPVYTQPTQYSFYGPTPAPATYAVATTYYQPVIGSSRVVTTAYYAPAAYTYTPGYYTGYYTPLYYRP
jgi:hypothetical protein